MAVYHSTPSWPREEAIKSTIGEAGQQRGGPAYSLQFPKRIIPTEPPRQLTMIRTPAVSSLFLLLRVIQMVHDANEPSCPDLDPGIHSSAMGGAVRGKDVDGRDKPGHDDK
jgi:hypothetical protein